MSDDTSELCEGALRCRGKDGSWIVANIGDPLYSTVTMMSPEYWDGSEWKKIAIEDGE